MVRGGGRSRNFEPGDTVEILVGIWHGVVGVVTKTRDDGTVYVKADGMRVPQAFHPTELKYSQSKLF